jgi:hypothetical protein
MAIAANPAEIVIAIANSDIHMTTAPPSAKAIAL